MDNIKYKTLKTQRKSNTDSLDWRDKGVVNEIKDQDQCGSCWDFSTCQAAESANAISTGKLDSYLEQNLVDCVTGCSGCAGGLMTTAFDYVIQEQGHFTLEDEYKYLVVEGTCKFVRYTTAGSVSKMILLLNSNQMDQLLSQSIHQTGLSNFTLAEFMMNQIAHPSPLTMVLDVLDMAQKMEQNIGLFVSLEELNRVNKVTSGLYGKIINAALPQWLQFHLFISIHLIIFTYIHKI